MVEEQTSLRIDGPGVPALSQSRALPVLLGPGRAQAELSNTPEVLTRRSIRKGDVRYLDLGIVRPGLAGIGDVARQSNSSAK
jgi:hypothetical protein